MSERGNVEEDKNDKRKRMIDRGGRLEGRAVVLVTRSSKKPNKE